MAYVFGCELPENLWFHVDMDVWLRPLPDGAVLLGMTDPALTRAGRIVHMGPRVGRRVEAGRSVATVESAKWVGPVPTPLPGVVAAANPDVLADPNLVNRDPYDRGWMVRFEPSVGPEAFEGFGLVFGPAAVQPYTEKLRALGLTCIRCAEPDGSESDAG